jgi:hypothetical protein
MAHTKDENCNDKTSLWYKYSSQAIIQSRREEDPATKLKWMCKTGPGWEAPREGTFRQKSRCHKRLGNARRGIQCALLSRVSDPYSFDTGPDPDPAF